MKKRTAIIFCIGRELLEGSVLDRNANFMASHVTELGFRVVTIQVLDDIEDEAVAAFGHAISLKPAYVLVTGGMGPGLDDITRQCLAKAAGVPLVLDPTAEKYLAASYRRLLAKGIVENTELTEERLGMARVPEGASVHENLSGTAPAVQLAVGSTTFFLLPGQPEELRRMFAQYVQPILEAEGPGGFRDAVHIDYPGGDESIMSRMLSDLVRRHPNVHSRARLQGSDARLTMRITLSVEGTDKEDLRKQLDQAAADLRARLGLEVSRTDASLE